MNPLLIVLLIITILIIGWYEVQRRQRNKKYSQLIQHLENLAKDNYTYEFNEYEEGALAILYSEIHKLVSELKSRDMFIKNQNKFLKKSLEDMTHQLKTPLSNLKILNELQTTNLYTEKIDQQILRLESLMDTLLILIKLDSNILIFKPTHVSILEVLSDFSSSYPDLVIEGKDYLVYIDPKFLKESIYNILDNKKRFYQLNINIQVYKLGQYVHLEISDDGLEISAIEKDKIFERYYSGGNRKEDSLGIGLSLAKEYLVHQGANIWLEDKNTFHITLPINDKTVS